MHSRANGPTEMEDISRSPKRARISEDATAAIETQCAHSETALEIDHMILDYSTFRTIQACFASLYPDLSGDSSRSLQNSLAVSDSFMSIFKARHPEYKADAELRLRVVLLKLATLFTQRLTSNPTNPSRSALESLRAANQERARAWIGSADRMPTASFDATPFDDELPISHSELERNRAHVLNALDVPAEDGADEGAFYGTSSCVSLLDVLPLFIQVSAARNAMSSSNLTDRWMQLACEFMIQACLEQYLVFGANGSDTMDEAFAWGYEANEDDKMDIPNGKTWDAKEDEINEMFEDEVYAAEVEGWSSTKTSYLSELFLPKEVIESDAQEEVHRVAVTSHLEMVAVKHPIASFESSLLNFLEALSNSIPEPVLVQLERGQLDGMTKQQTQDFLTECGVGSTSFFEDLVGFKKAAD